MLHIAALEPVSKRRLPSLGQTSTTAPKWLQVWAASGQVLLSFVASILSQIRSQRTRPQLVETARFQLSQGCHHAYSAVHATTSAPLPQAPFTMC